MHLTFFHEGELLILPCFRVHCDCLFCYGHVDIALDLLQKYPQLALEQDTDGDTALGMMAQRPSAFPSGTPLAFWRRWIYACMQLFSANFSVELS